jgi:membrane protein involved in colicin uptake
MNLSDLEKKLLMLAMDKAAGDGEVQAAATKFFRSLRERYPSGHELIKELMMSTSLSDMTDFMRKATQQQQPATGMWKDIMRQAQAHGRNFAARQQQRSAVEEEILRRQEEQRRQYDEWKRRQETEYQSYQQRMYEQQAAAYQQQQAAAYQQQQAAYAEHAEAFADAHAAAEEQAKANAERQKPPGFWKSIFDFL